MRFKAIIFDIDGTLVDALGVYQLAFNTGVARFGLPPVGLRPLAQKLHDGLTLEEIIVSFYPERDDASFLSACGEAVLAAFYGLTDAQSSLLPGAIEVLRLLDARGLTLAVATGRTTPSQEVKEWLGRIGIGHYFKAVVTSADVVQRKPAPDCVLECARQLGIPPADCLVVGDSVTDIGAARAAGAGIVSVLTGVSPEDALASLEPLALLPDLTGLLSFLGIDGDNGDAQR